jgi:hypothetical protein
MKEKTPMRKHSEWLKSMMERNRENCEDDSLDPRMRRKFIGQMLAYRDAWKESLKMLKEESEVIERAFNYGMNLSEDYFIPNSELSESQTYLKETYEEQSSINYKSK